MNRRERTWILATQVAFFIGLLPSHIGANGFRLADQDAFAAARGEAFVATANNPSAVYYNPGGITTVGKPQPAIGSLGHKIGEYVRFTASP
jgi:long-chain fatty acid transport protein